MAVRTRGADRLLAWGGAVSFLISLAFGVASYLGPFGRPIPLRAWPDEAEAIAINIGLFTLFAAHHSVMARGRAKAWIKSILPSHLERSTYVWIASLLFLMVCGLWRPVGGEVYRLESLAAVAAVALQAAGVLLTAAGVSILSWSELAGVRQALQATTHEVGEGHKTFSRGVYGFVRHPLYLGWMLMTLGTPHLTGTRLVFGVVSSAYLLAAIPWEERSLIAEHGEPYLRYRSQVRWRVVPGIY
ncbi:MAG: isoprenylcysteine carboxylmethyltransferase family protein [Luteitalea sp.]|nr:isoprenylcysteine carboxylmethyltransferase family protein [Luteitalea sp.]